jgi:uroporphyrinogen-III synthase
MAKPLLISTKTLNPELRERILQANIAYVAYNAIEVKEVPFNSPKPHDYVVLSSQNATRIALHHVDWLADKTLLCVGKSSESLLAKKGIKTLKTTENMAELVDFIQNLPKNASFLHLCGNKRLPLLATKMTEWKRHFSETVVYHTHPVVERFESPADALLFFSPSAVKSHEQQNDISTSICFCIGNATAKAFSQNPKEIHVVSQPRTDLVVAKAVHYFKTKQHA